MVKSPISWGISCKMTERNVGRARPDPLAKEAPKEESMRRERLRSKGDKCTYCNAVGEIMHRVCEEI